MKESKSNGAEPSKDELIAQVHALRQEIEDLKKSKQMLRAIMANAPVLISAKDLDGTVIMTNERFNLLQGPSAEGFVGKNVFDLFPPDIAEALWHNDQAAVAARKPIEVEEQVVHKDGSLHTYFTVKFPLFGDDRAIFGTCAISVDITERKLAYERSIRDELTGLFNRRHFNVVFPQQLRRAKREDQNFVLLILDLDCFKKYNDTYGHKKGDDVIASIGRVLTHTLKRYGDFCFRVGGEEFACIFSVREAEHARALAERIRQAVEDLGITHSGNLPSQKVTISIGVAVVAPEDDLSEDDIYNQADEALYQAKSDGRNRVCVGGTADV